MEVGVRELRDHLSRYRTAVRRGEEVTVTDHGEAVARLVPLDAPRTLDRLMPTVWSPGPVHEASTAEASGDDGGPDATTPRPGWVPLTWAFATERVKGIEPSYSAWEADVLPLNYTRVVRRV
jgi:prevent-host-death family protein